MRVSTGMIYDSGVGSIQRQTASLLHTQQQVATGRRMLSPSDDPVAAARALEVTQSKEINAQWRLNQDNARTSLGLVEGQLAGVGDVIAEIRERAVQAGNTLLADADRMAIARDLRNRFDQLMGFANAVDGTGQYLFSGYQGATRPFGGNPDTTVTYAGDDGQRALQVSGSRQMPVSDSGNDMFMRVRNGNGSFVARAGASNAGSGLIGAGHVTNPGMLTGDDYRIGFSMVAGTLNYTVTNTSTGTTAAAGVFSSGSDITFDGMSVSISGTPLPADTFELRPSTDQSIFTTLSNLIGALERPIASGGGAARISNAVGAALTDMDQALDNVLRVRASVGSRLAELDALTSVGEETALQHETTLSRLQDVDYAQAISQLTQERSRLEAAQQSFLRVSSLSLFNFL